MSASTPADDGDAGVLRADIRVLGGDPTDEEVAAMTAVLRAALEEALSGERRVSTGPTGWERSQRPLRRTLVPGTWRSFGR